MTEGRAATWQPQHPIELVAGTPPGGGQDRPARLLSDVIGRLRLVPQPLHVTNRVGKGGGAAWDHLRAHPGDPHVLAINSPPLLTNRLGGVSDYDHAQLTPIATLYTEYVAFVVPVAVPIETAADLVERLGRDPAAVTVSLATALGTSNHIALGALGAHAGVDPQQLRIRVFDSAREAVADALAGHAQVAAVSAVSALPELTDGRLRALTVTAPERMGGLFASAPTLVELGVDCVLGTWRGVIGPADLPRAAVEFWESTLRRATNDPAWRTEIGRQYWVEMFLGAEQTCAFLDEERTRLASALEQLG